MKKNILSIVSMIIVSISTVSCSATGADKTHKKIPLPTSSGAYRPVSVEMDGRSLCNSSAFTQIPNSPSLFLGRRLSNNPTECSKSSWNISLFTMDWSNSKMQFKSDALVLPAIINSGANQTASVTTAYDPYVTKFNGELWVTFECAGRGIVGASTCIGPLNKDTMLIDPTRTTLVVSGVNDARQQINFSASDPKLLSFNGALYLYWTVVYQNPKTNEFMYLTVRGMKLQQESSGAHKMWGTGSNMQPVGSNNPQLTTEVLSPNPNDPASNRVTDIFDLRQIGSRILITAGVGGSKSSDDMDACANPASKNFGCYRLEIFEAFEPLGSGAFGKKIATNTALPLNGQEYSRFIYLPDGSLAIMGRFVPLWTNPNISTALKMRTSIVNANLRGGTPAGMSIHPLNVAGLQFDSWK